MNEYDSKVKQSASQWRQKGAFLKQPKSPLPRNNAEEEDEGGGGAGKRMLGSYTLERLTRALNQGLMSAKNIVKGFGNFLNKEGLSIYEIQKTDLAHQRDDYAASAESDEKSQYQEHNEQVKEETKNSRQEAWEKASATTETDYSRFDFNQDDASSRQDAIRRAREDQTADANSDHTKTVRQSLFGAEEARQTSVRNSISSAASLANSQSGIKQAGMMGVFNSAQQTQKTTSQQSTTVGSTTNTTAESKVVSNQTTQDMNTSTNKTSANITQSSNIQKANTDIQNNNAPEAIAKAMVGVFNSPSQKIPGQQQTTSGTTNVTENKTAINESKQEARSSIGMSRSK